MAVTGPLLTFLTIFRGGAYVFDVKFGHFWDIFGLILPKIGPSRN